MFGLTKLQLIRGKESVPVYLDPNSIKVAGSKLIFCFNSHSTKIFTWPQSYEKYQNLCSQTCNYKYFLTTLVSTSLVKFNLIMLVFTWKYKLLK